MRGSRYPLQAADSGCGSAARPTRRKAGAASAASMIWLVRPDPIFRLSIPALTQLSGDSSDPDFRGNGGVTGGRSLRAVTGLIQPYTT